jgi:hypothetical protein
MMPAHVDERTAERLTESYESRYFDASPEERVKREEEIAGLRTGKWKLRNMGVCICLVSLTLAVAIARFRLWDIRNLKTATTPKSALRLIGLASIAWLALIPASLIQLNDEYAQDDLRPHNDVGHGSFLVLGVPAIVITWALAAMICSFVIHRHGNLPANLWCGDRSRPYLNVGITIFFGVLTALLVVAIEWSVGSFVWAVPSAMVGVYLALSSRAALLNRTERRT